MKADDARTGIIHGSHITSTTHIYITMATFQSIRELTRALYQGSRLLFDMFQKRNTVPIGYDDALEVLDGDEKKLQYLISFGVIEQVGDTLELDDAYQKFFEEVLAVNEDINVASVKAYIDKLNLKINTWLAAESNRRPQLMRDIRHIFRSINNATHRGVIDLSRNVDNTYKQEPNFKIKELRLKDFDEKGRQIRQLIRQTERLIDEQTIFFSKAMDIDMRQTVAAVKEGLNDADHGLIKIQAQIIDYLNRIEYQNRIVKHIRQLKYLRDQYLVGEHTNIKAVAGDINDVWMEKRTHYSTRVSVPFLRNSDAALGILSDVRRRLNKKTTIKSRLAGRIDKHYLEEQTQASDAINHQQVMDAFTAQSDNLFSFIYNYRFGHPVDEEQRLVIFLQLASQYADTLEFTTETRISGKYEYPLIYAR